MRMDNSAHQIRQRIIWIILRAFVAVFFATLLMVILATGAAIANNSTIPPFRELPILYQLEGYYTGQGSWEGVQALGGDGSGIGTQITLMDTNGLLVLDHGASDTPRVGQPYQPDERDNLVTVTVGGESVGTLVLDRQVVSAQLSEVTNILLPVSLVSFFLTLLAAILVVLLSRRIVTPLAEVIAAARSVTAGNLETRVEVRGPQDLRILTDSFNQMAASLERNDRERRDLLADIAHELRTPISVIRGRLEGILDGVYAADQNQISLVLKASYLLERLVEDLRVLTLAEARQLHFASEEVDLAVLAGRVIEVFSAEAEQKQIVLSLQSGAGSYRVTADLQRTEQVIGNLVGNALNYVPAGGKVWLTLEMETDWVVLAVNDNGPGIPAEDLPFIFDRFWRKEKSRSRATGGSGLGLAIAKQFVEIQGGSIAAENLPTGGLKINVALKTPS